MAHSDNLIATRITNLDKIHSRHDQPASLIPEDALIQHNGRKWCVISEGGTFHLSPVLPDNSIEGGYWIHELSDYHGDLYRPIHPTVSFADVEGATYAHDDGTHWHFAHCTIAEQITLAVKVGIFAYHQFSTSILYSQAKAAEATSTLARTLAIAKVRSLVKFAQEVGHTAKREVLGQTLGYYHRHNDQEHFRRITVKAINAVLADWKKKALNDAQIRADRVAVSPHALSVQSALVSDHTFEFRGVRVARLEAEKKKKEAPAETPTESGGDQDNHDHGD